MFRKSFVSLSNKSIGIREKILYVIQGVDYKSFPVLLFVNYILFDYICYTIMKQMKVYTQQEIRCAVQNTKRMYFYYLHMSKINDSKFVKMWVEQCKSEYDLLLEMVEDKEWVEKYGVLSYYHGEYKVKN